MTLSRIWAHLTLDELETLLQTLARRFEGLAENLDDSGFFDAIEDGGEADPFLECDIRLDGEDESFILQVFDEDEGRFETLFILSAAVAAEVVAALPPGARISPGESAPVH
jgi:hypothetical protein